MPRTFNPQVIMANEITFIVFASAAWGWRRFSRLPHTVGPHKHLCLLMSCAHGGKLEGLANEYVKDSCTLHAGIHNLKAVNVNILMCIAFYEDHDRDDFFGGLFANPACASFWRRSRGTQFSAGPAAPPVHGQI